MPQFNFANSQRLLKRALEIIPNGTQTFSKSRTQYPVGAAPLFINRGVGSQVWDVDGNRYTDFVCGLGSIILGYQDPDVDSAVMEQMTKGSIFSLPSPLEIEVSEMIRDMMPCAEMVRFGKNGSDATSGAVRLARYITGRDHVLVCEGHYHGWQDWFNGITERNGGVPDAVKKLTHTFRYNDIDSLHKGLKEWDTACVIMEPMTIESPKKDFLNEVQEACHATGTLFILDEVLSGLRFYGSFAQNYFDVIPDLSCLGKSMGNGYPISVIVGKAEYMRKMEEIHFSFTFGGDCIGLAATKATLNKFDANAYQEKVEVFRNKMGFLIEGDFAARPNLIFKDKILYKALQECYANGILTLGQINIMMAHSDSDFDRFRMIAAKAYRYHEDITLQGERYKSEFRIRA